MKAKPSKLDQFAETLLAMDDAKKTLVEMQAWLKEESVTVSSGRLSGYLASLRSSRLQASLLGQIATGAAQCRAVEKQFAQDPAPELETLIKLHRVLIMKLSTAGNAEPEFLKLADQMTNTVLACLSAQTRAAHKEREVVLAEQKQAETKKTEQEKALEYCLAAAKTLPAVAELFKAAFAALKKAQAK